MPPKKAKGTATKKKRGKTVQESSSSSSEVEASSDSEESTAADDTSSAESEEEDEEAYEGHESEEGSGSSASESVDEETDSESASESEGEESGEGTDKTVVEGDQDESKVEENEVGIAYDVPEGLLGDADDDGDDEEEEVEEEVEEDGGPKVGGTTKKGSNRVRNYHWSQEERHALFYTLLKHEECLKTKGADPESKRDAAWQEVLDAVNCVDNHARDLKQVRKKINTFYSESKTKNDKLMERLRKNKKVRSGLHPTEIMCLKWKEVPQCVGPKGVIVYSKKSGKDKKKRKIVSTKVKVEGVPAKSKKKSKKKKDRKDRLDADTKDKPIKKKHVDCEPKSKTVKKQRDQVDKTDAIKTPLKKTTTVSTKTKTPPKKKPPKKTPPKKTPPKKTIRNRKPLPDMDVEDVDTYTNGQLFKARQESKAKGLSNEHIDDSGDDDLSCAYISNSSISALKAEPYDSLIDLTGHVQFSSTPNVIVVGTPGEKSGEPLRRSPRNVKAGKDAPVAKKTLPFSTKGKGPMKTVLTAEPKASTSGLPLLSNPSSIESKGYLLSQEEMALRLAKVESLLITNEMDRRDDRKKRKELDSRMLDILEKCQTNQEVFIKGYQFALDNQEKMIQAVGYLSGVVDARERKADKRVQTDPCPYLDAQPLVVEEVNKEGHVVTVRAVKEALPDEKSVVISPGGHIVSAAIDLTVTGAPTKSAHSTPPDNCTPDLVVHQEHPKEPSGEPQDMLFAKQGPTQTQELQIEEQTILGEVTVAENLASPLPDDKEDVIMETHESEDVLNAVKEEPLTYAEEGLDDQLQQPKESTSNISPTNPKEITPEVTSVNTAKEANDSESESEPPPKKKRSNTNTQDSGAAPRRPRGRKRVTKKH